MKKRRLISGIMATALILSLLPTTAFAAISGVDNKDIKVGELFPSNSPLLTVNSTASPITTEGTLPSGMGFELNGDSTVAKITGSAQAGTVGSYSGIKFIDAESNSTCTIKVDKGPQAICADFGGITDVSSIVLPPGETYGISTYSKDASGYKINASGNHQPIYTYLSTNQTVATIDNTGVITTKAVGSTSIKINSVATDSYTPAPEKIITLEVTKSSPKVKLAGSGIVGIVGSVGDQTITATISGSFAESLDLTCSINGISKNTTITGDGNAEFRFSAAELNALRVGNYDIIFSSKGTNKNNAIASAPIGQLVIESYSVSVSPSVKDFGTILPGYGEMSPSTFTISNTGGNPITNLVVTIGGKNAANFTLNTDATASSLNNNGNTSFTVKPKVGLTSGYYTAEVKVSATNMTPVTREVNFTVNAPGYNATLSPSGQSFDTETAGYDEISPETFTIKNTGTGNLNSIAVTLEGTHAASFVLNTSGMANKLDMSGGNNTSTSFSVNPKKGLAVGVYSATVKVSATNFTGVSSTLSFTVEKEDPENPHSISEGKTGTWTIGSDEYYSITVKADYKKFKEVLVAGKKINKKYFEVEKGSTVVTFTPEYLKTLKKGKHKISIVFSDGTADATLTIQDASEALNNTSSGTFVDVMPNEWYYNAVMTATKKGLFAGTTSNAFSPNQPTTRGVFALVLSQLNGANLNSYTKSSFSDVNINSYYGKSIAWAADKGLIAGSGDGFFSPEDLVTREQMAVILSNYIQKMNVKITAKGNPAAFNDVRSISPWAASAVTSIQKYGLIGGRPGNMFEPQGTATRAEVAQIFVNLMNATGK